MQVNDLLEDASVAWLERERDRLYSMQGEASQRLSEVKSELMLRALIAHNSERQKYERMISRTSKAEQEYTRRYFINHNQEASDD